VPSLEIEMCFWVNIGLSLLSSSLRLFLEDSNMVIEGYRQVVPLFKSRNLFHCSYTSVVIALSVCLVD
jgi:hypothetical protein